MDNSQNPETFNRASQKAETPEEVMQQNLESAGLDTSIPPEQNNQREEGQPTPAPSPGGGPSNNPGNWGYKPPPTPAPEAKPMREQFQDAAGRNEASLKQEFSKVQGNQVETTQHKEEILQNAKENEQKTDEEIEAVAQLVEDAKSLASETETTNPQIDLTTEKNLLSNEMEDVYESNNTLKDQTQKLEQAYYNEEQLRAELLEDQKLVNDLEQQQMQHSKEHEGR